MLTTGGENMGQRIQIVVQVPEVDWGGGNPNNKSEMVLVYHNQWLFGRNFLQYNARLIKAIKSMIKQHTGDYPIEYRELVDNAIKHANNFDLSYMTNSSIYDEEDCDRDTGYNKDLAKSTGAIDFLEYWDNNNGYFYIKMSKDNKVSYDILTGLEDADEVKSITPKKYLNQFYKDSEIIEMGAYETIRAILYLKNQKKIDCLMELNKFRTRLKKIEV